MPVPASDATTALGTFWSTNGRSRALFSRFRTGADNKVKVTGVRSSARNTATSAAVRTTVESLSKALGVGFAFWAQIDGTPKKPTAHAVEAKESDCGCAGIYCAPFAIESYARVFEEEGALDRLEGFASEHGPRFYGLPLNPDFITLERTATPVPPRIPAAGTEIVPFHAGEVLDWRFVA